MSIEEELTGEAQEILTDHPQERVVVCEISFCSYQGYWVPTSLMKGILSVQKHFVANDSDIIVASCPKSGTTWLKAITFSVINRGRFAANESPLLRANPHELIPFLETNDQYSQQINIEDISQPRLLSTHIPYTLLPSSVKYSNCKVVYIYRNPMDLFVSLWYFFPKLKGEDKEAQHLEEFFDMFCRGIHLFGPVWDHVMEFWNASLERPQNVLFLKYEDLKENVIVYIKAIAEFLGLPFSLEEERQGIIEEIANLCSFEKLKSLEANKGGKSYHGIPNSSFFRKGIVGDSKNILTKSMIERVEKLMKEKHMDRI